MIFTNLRLAILNWLAAPSYSVFNNVYKKEKTMAMTNPSQTTYTLGVGGGSVPGVPYNNGTGHNYYTTQPQVQQMNLGTTTINFNVAKANGGWIVQVNPHQNHNTINLTGLAENRQAELYLIHDSEDFDAALGKIVTMSCLKGESK